MKNSFSKEINIYKVENFEQVLSSLAKLLWKVIKDKKVFIFCPDDIIGAISDYLWKFNSPDKVLPNGTRYDLFPDLQRIYISSELSNLNNADFLIILNKCCASDFSDFSKVFFILDLNYFNLKLLPKECKKWELNNGKWIEIT